MHIREMRAADRDALAGLLGRIENFTDEEVSVATGLLDEIVLRPGECGYEALVAFHDESAGGPPIGYVCYGPTPMTERTWDMYWIATDPAARGRGVGRALHGAMLDDLRKKAARLVRIETSSAETYDDTARFYERAGYRLVSRVPGFYREGDDLLTYFLGPMD